MAYSYITRNGDGSTNTFSISFSLGFLERTDVDCRVGTEVDGIGSPVYRTITWINDGVVTISGDPPGLGVPVVFRRTVSKTILKHDYSDGAVIEEQNLDESNLQLMMAIHELLDGRMDALMSADFVTNAQLAALEASLQAQIDALAAQVATMQDAIDDAVADATAAAIAAVQDTIDAAIAAALADLEFAGGGLLKGHEFAEYSSASPLTNPMQVGVPTLSDGTEILTCTITPQAIGDTIRAEFQGNLHNSTNSRGIAAMFMDGDHKASAYYVSYSNGDQQPAGITIVAEIVAASLDPITVVVRAGPYSLGYSARFNDSLYGGQTATLTVDDISPAGTGEIGSFVKWA